MRGNEFEISRRRFIGWLGAALAVPLGGLWFLSTDRVVESLSSFKRRIPVKGIEEGVSFHDEYILHRRGEEITVLSSYCSHLGCRISTVKNGKLVCPCHGSEYDPSTGNILKGPASRNLQLLSYEINSGELTIKIRQFVER